LSLLRTGRRVLLVIAGVLALVVFAVVIGGYAFSVPGYQGPASDHFDGKRFRNTQPTDHGGFGALVKWMATRKPPPWQQRTGEPGPKPPERVEKGQLRVTFVNHATVLIQQDGINILTDPIWSDRTSPVSFVGPRRHHGPGLRFDDLPPIDVVLISHNHYDHLDLPTLRRLQDKFLPRFFIGLGSGTSFVDLGLPVTEMDWWKQVELAPGVELHGVPAQHFSNRGLFDRDRTLWMGFVIKGPAGVSYFAGDTGPGPHFAAIKRRFGAPRLAVLPIGAFQPRWFMSGVHIGPVEAVAAHDTLAAGTSLAIHFGTFPLGDDAQDEAPQLLEATLAKRGSARPRFWLLGFGEGRDVPAPPP
jgi:L-ascorbate metabolism protein UlaG (beta-lactamase superfamily)